MQIPRRQASKSPTEGHSPEMTGASLPWRPEQRGAGADLEPWAEVMMEVMFSAPRQVPVLLSVPQRELAVGSTGNHQCHEAWPPPAGEQGGAGLMRGPSLLPRLLPETRALVLTRALMFWVIHLHLKEGQVIPSGEPYTGRHTTSCLTPPHPSPPIKLERPRTEPGPRLTFSPCLSCPL